MSEEDLVAAAQKHAKESHGMELTMEQALAMAESAGAVLSITKNDLLHDLGKFSDVCIESVSQNLGNGGEDLFVSPGQVYESSSSSASRVFGCN